MVTRCVPDHQTCKKSVLIELASSGLPRSKWIGDDVKNPREGPGVARPSGRTVSPSFSTVDETFDGAEPSMLITGPGDCGGIGVCE